LNWLLACGFWDEYVDFTVAGVEAEIKGTGVIPDSLDRLTRGQNNWGTLCRQNAALAIRNAGSAARVAKNCAL
jgi:hypothetical protein